MSTETTPADEGPRTVIPPEQHDWFQYMDHMVCCRQCGMVRCRDGKNKPCKGAAKVTLR
jgi:hypothetical protein